VTAPARPRHSLALLADKWDEGLPGSPEETCAMRTCAAQLREALRAQAEAEAGLRELVTQLMSDPWSYHYEGSGTTTRCVGCGEKKGAAHEHWCPIPSIAAALAQAGGEQV